MELLFMILASLLLSACSTNVNDDDLMYSFHTVEFGHTNNAMDNIEMTIEEEGEVFNRDEIEDLELNVAITNQTGETIEIGNYLEIERFDDGTWELVEPPENFTEEGVLISIPHDRASEYVISIEERFLANDELTGGTYRVNNNDAFYAYFVVSEFSNE
jgi:hypothetical protein